VKSASAKTRLAGQQPFDVTGCSGQDLTAPTGRGKHTT